MNTKILIALVVIVLALLGVIYFSAEKAGYQSVNDVGGNDQTPAEDSTAAINSEIENIDLGDVDAEFKQIDQDLNSL